MAKAAEGPTSADPVGDGSPGRDSSSINTPDAGPSPAPTPFLPPQSTDRSPGAVSAEPPPEEKSDRFGSKTWHKVAIGVMGLFVLLIIAAIASGPPKPAADSSRSAVTANQQPTALEVESQDLTTDTDSAEIKGTASTGSTVQLTWTGGSVAATVDEGGSFSATVTGLQTGLTSVAVAAKAPSMTVATKIVTVTRLLSESEYKASAKKVPYDQLNKDPDSLSGQVVAYDAKIFQYDSATGTDHMLVEVTRKPYDFWDDNVFLDVTSLLGADVDNKDIIKIWGEVVGSYSYEARLGTNTVPRIKVRYLELVKKQD